MIVIVNSAGLFAQSGIQITYKKHTTMHFKNNHMVSF